MVQHKGQQAHSVIVGSSNSLSVSGFHLSVQLGETRTSKGNEAIIYCVGFSEWLVQTRLFRVAGR